MKLSILICTLPSRIATKCSDLIAILNKQVGGRKDIEILALFDNKRRSVGEKRNDLISIANGLYFSFIDDDDFVAEDYVSSIIEEIDKGENPDCIVFDTKTHMVDFGIHQISKFGIEFDYWRSRDKTQRRCKPSHLNVWKTKFAEKYMFEKVTFGEDTEWCDRIWKDVSKQSRIDKILLYPRFERKLSETRTSPLKTKILLRNMWKISDVYNGKGC